MTSSLVSSARILIAAFDGDFPVGAALQAFREALHRHQTEDGFAGTCWSIEDVRRFRPDITDAEARTFLEEHASLIQDAMVEAGWDAIETLLDEGH